MDFEAEARRDVEETLAAGRELMERGISRGRLGLFATLTLFMALLVGALFSGAGEGLSSLQRVSPLLMFGAGLLYAALVWRQVARRGARAGLTSFAAFADVVVVVVIVATLRHTMESPGGAPEPLPARFDMYGLAPILMIIVMLGCLRVDARLRVALGLFTVAAYLVAIRLDLQRFELPQLLAATLIGVGAMVGSKTSDRIAELLDRQSRLSILRSYLPAAFAEQVSSDSVDLSAALRPQALEVTLLVSDLRGFTSTSERLEPSEVVAMLTEYHAAMLEAVEASGGVVDKFLGDGMLVVFGLPAPGVAPSGDAGAADATRCAAAMLQRLKQLNASRMAQGKPPLAIGIGIHTGPVVAGTIGAGRRREFTVIGDAVNTASRLEGLTKTAQAPILLSAATVGRLDARGFSLRELEPMAVKGKAEPVKIFALEQPPSAASAER